jgi:hypothetical protein
MDAVLPCQRNLVVEVRISMVLLFASSACLLREGSLAAAPDMQVPSVLLLGSQGAYAPTAINRSACDILSLTLVKLCIRQLKRLCRYNLTNGGVDITSSHEVRL